MTSSTSPEDREFDVIIYGATGFTGRLVAEYFAQHYAKSVRWALAGRDLARLASIRDALAARFPLEQPLPRLPRASSADPSSLLDLARRARVILTTVGPYAIHGTPLVAACVEARTHYVDITGETPWVREIIDRFHQEALQRGVCVVPMCGFDSVPADLGAYLCVLEAAKFGARVTDVQALVSTNGGPSGGTIASLMNLLDGQNAHKLRESSAPFYLNPAGSFSSETNANANPQQQQQQLIHLTPHDRDQMFPKYAADHRQWTIPFIMAGPNTRLVRRSQALQVGLYGPGFSYNEATAVGNIFLALLLNALLLLTLLLLFFGPTRRLIARFLPAAGEGPSEERRRRSRFSYRFIARTTLPNNKVAVTISGGDPGYTETAKMLSEAALCLAMDAGQRQQQRQEGGVLTASSCMGLGLVERLQNAGMIFKVEVITN